MLVVAFSFWLSRYELLYSTQGVVYGAGYFQMPMSIATPLQTSQYEKASRPATLEFTMGKLPIITS
jgi:Uncharacterised protein family (UPF0182)